MAEEVKKQTTKKVATKTTTTKKASSTTSKPTTSKKDTSVKKETVVKVETKKVEETPKVEKKEKVVVKSTKFTSRLKEKYNQEVKTQLVKKFNYKSIMQAPRLEKIVINVGVGDAVSNSKALDESVSELAIITGQKPVITKAKKSIANFKLREGTPIGAKVTLRGEYMYSFFDKLTSIALPRVRDFRGVSKNSFDGRGNYTLGVKEQLIFPEIDYDKVSKIRGMDIVIVTTAKTDEEAQELLSLLGMPFQR